MVVPSLAVVENLCTRGLTVVCVICQTFKSSSTAYDKEFKFISESAELGNNIYNNRLYARSF